MRGRSDIQPDVNSLPHPAAPLLDRIRRNGVPVVMSTEPWDREKLDSRLERGPHRSALDHAEFLREEFLDFCKKGFWMILPYRLVKDEPGLRLSPLGVVPQRERRPRIIVDYSFYDVNNDTVKLAPPGAMQFGKAHERIMENIAFADPKYGATYGYKIDISDGFYRIPVSNSGATKLGVLLPPGVVGDEPMVAFPLTLPMGWTESPPWFCTFTETACDLANHDLRKNKRHPPHHLEAQAGLKDFEPSTELGDDCQPIREIPQSHRAMLRTRPLATVDVFVDDFMGVGQDHPANPIINQRRTVLHNIDRIFRPNDERDPPYRKEPVSQSKLDKEDAALQTKRRFLGWDIGTKSRTLQTAQHRRQKALTALNETIGARRVGHTKWDSLTGQLQSLVPGMPGAVGQFSILRAARHQGPDQDRVRVTEAVKEQLRTFRDLLLDEDPTLLEELVPGRPHNLGASDAAKAGMGGVWFTHDGEALLWRFPFPKQVQRRLVSSDNPRGTISIADLETSATIMHQAVLGQEKAVFGETHHGLADNTNAVSWRVRGSTTTTKPAAFLLRQAALLTRQQRSLFLWNHIAGEDNKMADDASRLWGLDDAELLTHFNAHYPQATSWRLCQPPIDWSSRLISALLQRTCDKASLDVGPRPKTLIGTSGPPSASAMSSTRSSWTRTTQCPTYNSSSNATGTAERPSLGNRSGLEQRRMRYARYRRRWPYWGPETRVCPSTGAWTSESPDNSPRGNDKIRRRDASNQSRG